MTPLVPGRRDARSSAPFAAVAVLLLAGASALVALAPAQVQDGTPDGLAGALSQAHAALSSSLDLALADAVRAAALAGAGDLAPFLDAALVARLSGAFPMRGHGLELELVDVQSSLAGVTAVASGGDAPVRLARPEGRACLSVVGAGGRLSAEVVAAGATGRPGALVSRASAALGALGEPGGALGYRVGTSLWQLAQGRALSGERDAGALLTAQDIEGAVREGLRSVCEGRAPMAPAPPTFGLEEVVRQSVEGAVRASVGCADGCLGLEGTCGALLAGLGLLDGEGVPDGDTLAFTAARELGDLVVAALGEVEAPAAGGGAPADLSAAIAAAIARLDAMASRPDAVPTWAAPLARLGLASAREALLSVAALGREVASAQRPPGDSPSTAGEVVLAASLAGLSVDLVWTGETACEPGWAVRLVDGDGGAPPWGALPYTSRCALRLRGRVQLDGALGAGGPGAGAVAPRPVGWTGSLYLPLEVSIATGWPLDAVPYTPSRTLAPDLSEVARAVWGEASDGLGQLAARVRDAGEWVASQLQGIARDMVTAVLDESAYELSRSLLSIGESLLRGQTDAALNTTWRLLSRIASPVLRDRLTWRFEALGLDVTASLDPIGQAIVIELAHDAVEARLEVRRLADARNPLRARPIDGHAWAVLGRATADLGRESVVVELDPLTVEHAAVVTATARWGDDGRGGPSQELVVEAVSASPTPVETGVRLRDLLGAAAPLLAAGAAWTVDAGLVIRSERGAAHDLGRLALDALERAWLASVKGHTVGSLAGATASRPDASLFAETLLRELYFALLLEATGVVTEVEAFLEVDPPSPGWPKVHVGAVIADPLEVLLPLAVWAGRTLGRLAGEGAAASMSGAGAGLPYALASRALLRVELLWTVELPPCLARGGAPPEVGLVVRAQANVAALRCATGSASGGWEAAASVELRAVPASALRAWPGLGSASWGWADVLLLRARLRDAGAPLLLLSQVLYDACGKDADLEYVEVLNAGGSVVDAGGLVLEDDDGAFVVPPHRPMMPGGRLLVARDRAGPWEAWGVWPDVWGMGLRLGNDGDVVRLGDGAGRTLDEVAWEGLVPGWERLSAREGEALLRMDGRTSPCDPGSWTVGAPRPARGGGL